MSHADPGPLASYNSLQDPHLGGYFANTRMRNHLRKSGLVDKSGKIVSEKTYRLKMAKKEHQDHVRDLLATAIVHKALDMERSRQHELRKRLDEMYKVDLVKRVKMDREKRGDEAAMSLLTTREKVKRSSKRRPKTAPSQVLTPTELGYDEETGRLFYNVVPSESSNGDEINSLISGSGYNPYYKPYPPATYPMPAPPPSRNPREGSKSRTSTAGQKRSKLKLHRYTYLAHAEPAVAHKIQLQSLAEVTMRFLGPKLQLKNDMFPDERLCEVMVLQQHCGGSSLCVFRELLPPNTIFTFISRRHRGTPFGLTFYIDSMQDIRLSSCCEYKHKPGHILGGKNGHFQFINVEGAAPCYRCQIAFSMKNQKGKSSKKSGERETAFDDKQSISSEREPIATEKDEQQKEHDVSDDVTERYEVTITKVSSGNDDEDNVMVDTTTQTPRDGDVTEEPRKESMRRVEDNKEKQDVKDDEGGKVGEDSGIHQDGGEEETYADDDFEEDEDVKSDKEKGESSSSDDEEEKNPVQGEVEEEEEEYPNKNVGHADNDEVDEEIEDETETETKEKIKFKVKDEVVEELSENENERKDDHSDKSSSEDEGDKDKEHDSKSSSSSSSSSSESEDSDYEGKASQKKSKKDSAEGTGYQSEKEREEHSAKETDKHSKKEMEEHSEKGTGEDFEEEVEDNSENGKEEHSEETQEISEETREHSEETEEHSKKETEEHSKKNTEQDLETEIEQDSDKQLRKTLQKEPERLSEKELVGHRSGNEKEEVKEKQSGEHSEKNSKNVSAGESENKDSNSVKRDLDHESEKGSVSSLRRNPDKETSKNSEIQSGDESEPASNNYSESEMEGSRTDLKRDIEIDASQKSEERSVLEDSSIPQHLEVKDTESHKENVKGTNANADMSSTLDLKSETDKHSEVDDSDRHSDKESVKSPRADSKDESDTDSNKVAKKDSDSEKDSDDESEKDSDSDSDSDKDFDSDKDSSSDSDDESVKSSARESKSESEGESLKSSETKAEKVKQSVQAEESGEKRPDSRSGILHDPSKTPDLSDEEGKPKKTVSFNEEVKVYVGVDENGDGEDVGDNEVHESTSEDHKGSDGDHPTKSSDEGSAHHKIGNPLSEGENSWDAAEEVERKDRSSGVIKGDVGKSGVVKSEGIGNGAVEDATDKEESKAKGDKSEEQDGGVVDEGPPKKEKEVKEEIKTKPQEEGILNADDIVDGADGNAASENEKSDTEQNKMNDHVEETSEGDGESHVDDKESEIKINDGKGSEQGNSPELVGNYDVKPTEETRQGDNTLGKDEGKASSQEETFSPDPSDTDSGSKQNESEKDTKDTDTDIDLDPGNDPDSVGGEEIPERALKAVGTKPGAKHEGSVKPLVEGQKDLEIASVALNSSQVGEVAAIVESNSEVGSLSLRNVSLGDDGVKQLSSALKNSANVKMLNLNVNNIGPEGAQHVADTVRNNTAMKMLLLHGNPLGDQGVVFIVDAILENEDTAVSTLDIGDCGLGDVGAVHVSRLLGTNNTITDLNLSANQFTHKGWREISEALKKNKKLRALSLDYNKITDEDVKVLAEGLRHSTTLRSVDLEANRIRDEGGRLLLDVVKENEKLIDMTLMPMNQIDESILTQIKDILDNRIRSRPGSANSEVATT